jgi:hypothetical protein
MRIFWKAREHGSPNSGMTSGRVIGIFYRPMFEYINCRLTVLLVAFACWSLDSCHGGPGSSHGSVEILLSRLALAVQGRYLKHSS